ncbi:MAG: hypothetical protein HOM96_04640 [Rickettsiales bacterium]|jgi:hypothetical protein|nr:hypothetical protein [Rickettsiales bacterium]
MNKEEFLQALKKSFTKGLLRNPFVNSRWKKSERGNEGVIERIAEELFPKDLTPVTYDSLTFKLKDGLGLKKVPSSILGCYYQYLYIASLLPEGDNYINYSSEATKLNVFFNLYQNLKVTNPSLALSQETLDSDVRKVIGTKKRLQHDHYILFCLHQLCEKIGNIYIPEIFNQRYDIIADDGHRKACYKFLICGLEISKSINQAENLLSTQLTAEDKLTLADFKLRNKDKSTTEEKSVLYQEVYQFIADKQLPPPPPLVEMERKQLALAKWEWLRKQSSRKLINSGELIAGAGFGFETGINALEALNVKVLALALGAGDRVATEAELALASRIQVSIISFKEVLTKANEEQKKLGRFIQDNVTGTDTTLEILQELAATFTTELQHHDAAMQVIKAQTQPLKKAITDFKKEFTDFKEAAARQQEVIVAEGVIKISQIQTSQYRSKLEEFKLRNQNQSRPEEKSVLFQEVCQFIAEKQAFPPPLPSDEVVRQHLAGQLPNLQQRKQPIALSMDVKRASLVESRTGQDTSDISDSDSEASIQPLEIEYYNNNYQCALSGCAALITEYARKNQRDLAENTLFQSKLYQLMQKFSDVSKISIDEHDITDIIMIAEQLVNITDIVMIAEQLVNYGKVVELDVCNMLQKGPRQRSANIDIPMATTAIVSADDPNQMLHTANITNSRSNSSNEQNGRI